jgi:hypothetical protein
LNGAPIERGHDSRHEAVLKESLVRFADTSNAWEQRSRHRRTSTSRHLKAAHARSAAATGTTRPAEAKYYPHGNPSNPRLVAIALAKKQQPRAYELLRGIPGLDALTLGSVYTPFLRVALSGDVPIAVEN